MMSFQEAVYLLFLANGVLLGAAAIALIRFRKQAKQFERYWQTLAGTSLADTRTINAQAAKNMKLERKVSELQSVVRTLSKQTPTAGEHAENRLPMDNAVRMAKHGATIDDLIRNCGLNIAEAQLMRKLHAQASADTPSPMNPD